LEGKNFWALVTKTSGPKVGNPLPIGAQVRDPSFATLMALRLQGNGGGLQFAEGDAALQAAHATIRTSKALEQWILQLQLDKEAVYATLGEKFGKWSQASIPKYIDEVWAIKHNGHAVAEAVA
jgi:hypothetical protein